MLQEFFTIVGIAVTVFVGVFFIAWGFGFIEMGIERVEYDEEDENEN